MTSTDYEKQAQDFLDRFAIKFRCTLSDSKVAPWNDDLAKPRHHYRVTLSKGGKWEYAGHAQVLGRTQRMHRVTKSARITFDFFGSIADAEKGEHPTACDVLACLSGDVYCLETFKEFCSEFGESEDSIKALQTFRRCLAFSKRLKSFFTAEEIEALSKIN